MDQKLLAGFVSLFWGQTNAWFNLSHMKTEWGILTPRIFQDHLKGKQELGIYCINDLNQCYWCCIDIDDGDYQKAMTIRDAWHELGIKAWIEKSKSKGFHIWVFFAQTVTARAVRNAGLNILTQLGLSKLELNPKQDNLYSLNKPSTAPKGRTFGLGNLIRIPYWGQANPGRMVVMEGMRELSLAEFVPKALRLRVHPSALGRLASQQESFGGEHPDRQSKPRGGKLSEQDAYRAWVGIREIERGERDSQLYTLSKIMKACDLTYSQAIDEMTHVYKNMIADKYDFPLSKALQKVENAYGNQRTR